MKKICLIFIVISKFCFAELFNGYFGIGLGVSGSSESIGPILHFNAGTELQLNFFKISVEGFAEQAFWLEEEKKKPNPNLITPNAPKEEERIYPLLYGIKGKLILDIAICDFYFSGGLGEEKSKIRSTSFRMLGAGIQVKREIYSIYFETNYFLNNNDIARLNLLIGTKIYFKS